MIKIMQAKTIEDLVFIINQGVVVYFPDRKVYEETRPHWWSRKTEVEVLEYTPEPIFCSMEAAIMQVGGLDEADCSDSDAPKENPAES